jgi:uroporphyrinogen-III synthase
MRVLVTRPMPEAEATAARLLILGHEPLVAPLFRAEPVASPIIPRDATAFAITSPRTIAFLSDKVVASMRDRPAFAVGDRTAEALREAGFRDVRSAAGDVRALATLIAQAGLPAGATILSPGGETRAGDLGAALERAGLRLEAPVVYRMVSEPALPATIHGALAAQRIDAALHYSPNAASVLLRLIEDAGLVEPGAHFLHACLSEAVAAPLRARGWVKLAVADTPDEDALLTALFR